MAKYIFNSPPGWPPQSPGWTPPDGWTPDPDWPPAPADWVFWVLGPEPTEKPPAAATPVEPVVQTHADVPSPDHRVATQEILAEPVTTPPAVSLPATRTVPTTTSPSVVPRQPTRQSDAAK